MILAASALLMALGYAGPGQVETASRAAEAYREAALFGEDEPDSEREAALFGADDSDREAALFGTPDVGTSSATPAAEPRGPAPSQPSTGGRLLDALRGQNDYLDIGGVAWFWAQMSDLDNTEFGGSRFSSPNFLDVYMDARPNDRVRAYVRGRLNYDPSIDPTALTLTGQTASRTRVRLDQLWLKFDVLRTAFVTVGQQRIRWGTGRIWNPTDFMNPSRLDALNFLDTRLGVPLVKVHLPIESLGWNFYAIADLNGASSIKELGGALRAEALFGPAEVSLSAALQKDRPVRLGADISLPVWEFDLRVEAALLHNVTRPFFDERSDARTVDGIELVDTVEEIEILVAAIEGTPVDRSDDWIPQIVVGLDYAVRYNDDDTLLFALEYFFNDAGTDLPQTYVPLLFNGGFESLYLGRHYLSAAAYLVGPGDWDDSTFSLVGLANLSDQTGLARLNYSVQLLTYLRLNAFVSVLAGERGGEFRLALRVPPIDEDLLEPAMLPAALASGLSFEPTVWQTGVTLVLNF